MNGNNTVIDDETRAYQEETAQIRFRQNLVHGLGAAAVFGLMTAVAQALFAVVKTATLLSASGALAGLGIAGLVVVGIGLLSMSSRLSSQLVRIEQDHHAKEIAKGINGKSPEMGQQKPVAFPSQDKAAEAPTTLQSAANDATMNEAQPTVSGVKLEDKVVSLDAARQARRA